MTVLVTHAPVTAEDVCTSTDLVEEEDLQQNNRLPIVTTIEGATTSGEIKPYFQGRRSLITSLIVIFKLELNGLMYCSGAGESSDTSGSSCDSPAAR